MGSYSVPGVCLPLRVGSHCSPGYFRDASWIKRRIVQPFPMSILDQADNPRRLVAHDDDSDVSSCAYPCATVLGGIRGWVPRDRLSLPLHGVESQSQPWGTCIILASRGEELHLYTTQVIKDLSGPSPSSLTDHVISRERIAASPCTRLSRAPSPMATLTPCRCLRGFLRAFPPSYFRSRSHHRQGLPCSH